ncbi:MAG: hypothetical protein MUF03_13560 [Rubrivivax sp.]|jgi:hypothetical protein|nr:hypothetical protein [Rubrivivax sp.]
MAKTPFDLDELVTMFETATAQQGAQLRKAAGEATLAALQGRELTLKNIKAALKAVSEAAGAGAAKNAAGIDAEALLDQAVAGMDDAVLKAVEANRVALQQFLAQGADLRDKHLKKALDDLEKIEDTMFAAVRKAASTSAMPEAWNPILEKMQAGGTLSGAKATATAEQMAEQMQTAVRSTRAAGLRAAQAMAESYAAMVSGVLLGMSESMQSAAPAKAARRKPGA